MAPNLIGSRVALDLATLSLLLVSIASPVDSIYHAVVFPIPYLLTLLTAGPTSRWTLSFPMAPFVVLQAVRYASPLVQSPKTGWAAVLIMTLSILLVGLSAALCVLFPPRKLPNVSAPYHVGAIDFFLSIPVANGTGQGHAANDEMPTHVSVRLLYPTSDEPGRGISYLNPDTAKEYCRQTMLFGAPPMLKKFGWFLHYWRLIRLPVKKNAQLLSGSTKLSVVIYSHGLGGSNELYSYQTMTLASQGHLVLSINHSDGSAPAIQRQDGSILSYDHSVATLWMNSDHATYVRRRRRQADYRAREFIAATEAFFKLDEDDSLDLAKAGLSLRGRLDKINCTFIGHSFGGATAMVAASRRPDLVQQVVAHEPAIDWMTDDCRRSLFAPSVMKDLTHTYTGGTGGYEFENNGKDSTSLIHDLNLLVMYSNEWHDKNWGESHIVEELYRRDRLGRRGGTSKFMVVKDSHHMEFSDVAMLTPTWLGRVTGQAGKRDPIDTAAEIERATVAWLRRARIGTPADS